MLRRWLQRRLPVGFKMIFSERRVIVVREGLERELEIDRWERRGLALGEESPFHGRQRLRSIHLSNDETVLVRSYHHGGIFRHLTGEFFFTWPPRPFVELALTEEARRRGIPTLEVLGAWIERIAGPVYRGWLMSRELTGARDLWAVLQGGPCEGEALFRAVAQSVRRMHRRGIYHADLNLKNILIRQEGEKIVSYLIDLDKARLFAGEVPRRKAQRNLRRLLRSACKLDPDRRFFSNERWELLVRSYQEAEVG